MGVGKRSRRREVATGLLAVGPALLVVVGLHIATARPGILEAISDGFVTYIPLNVFSAGVEALGPLAKGLLYLGISAGVALAGALLAPPLLAWTRGRSWPMAGLMIGALTLAITELVVLPVFQGGFLGGDLQYDRNALHVPLALGALAYGCVVAALRDAWLAEAPAAAVNGADALPAETAIAVNTAAPTRAASALAANTAIAADVVGPQSLAGALSRRLFLARTLVLIGAGSLLGAFVGVGSQVIGAARHGPSNPKPGFADPFGPTPALTPVPDFYVVNKNLLPTTVDEASWRLVVDGLVDRPLELSLFELRQMPSQTGYRTLECISTDISRGDHLISNQTWRGVRVSDLLDRAGVQAAAGWILWEADDGYTESLSLDVARHPDTWIAYDMGDQPLTSDHGFPARVLIAGRFGMKQPKWLRRMTLADHNERGYWEERGWDEQAVVRTMSRIDYPTSGDDVLVNTPFPMTGIAFAGDRGISGVEVSLDGGLSWLDAAIETNNPATAPLTWVRWRNEVSLPRAGAYSMLVRATDGEGQLQDAALTDPLPSGSTGYHKLLLIAR